METVDVVVVGAGYSGLIAARDLVRAGHSVIVCESADRVGGRSLAETTALGSRVDLGGQWIGHDHERLQQLVAEHGLTAYEMYTGPIPKIIDRGQQTRTASVTNLVTVAALAALSALRRLPRNKTNDNTSVHEWLQKVPGRARRLLEVAAAVSWTSDLRRVSVATVGQMIQAQHGLMTMLNSKGGAQDSLIVEAAGTLPELIAADLGDVVRTSTPVTAIERDDDGATVTTPGGTIRARRVIVTVPPPRAQRIDHEPALPEARQQLEHHTFMGSVYKALAIYPKPFWRDHTQAGDMMFLDQPGFGLFDSSPPGGPGHLCILVGGPDAESVDSMTADERRDHFLTRAAAHLGNGVLTPASWHEKSWHLDEHAGGGYLCLPELGAPVSDVPMASEPIGPIHWAGTETAADHPGYFDGAIESGQRAAREVINVLRSH